MTKLMIKETKMWRQQAKNFWLTDGDKNTKYDEAWISQQEAIAETFIEFYQGLITSTNPILHEEALNPMPKLLIEENRKYKKH